MHGWEEDVEAIALKDCGRMRQRQRAGWRSNEVPKCLTLVLCPRLLFPVKLARFIQVISVAAWFRLFRVHKKLITQA